MTRGSAGAPQLELDRLFLPAHLVRGLDRLLRSPPLWPVDPAAWGTAVAGVADFAEEWDAQARAAGWLDLELYGLHRFAPWANVSAMGAAWLLARGGYTAIAVTPDVILVRSGRPSGHGAALAFHHFAPGADAVLAWSLCTSRQKRAGFPIIREFP